MNEDELVKYGKQCAAIAFYFPTNDAPVRAQQVQQIANTDMYTLRQVRDYVYQQMQNLDRDVARAVWKKVIDNYGPERGFVKAFCAFKGYKNAVIISNGFRDYEGNYEDVTYVLFDVSDDVINFVNKMWKLAQKQARWA